MELDQEMANLERERLKEKQRIRELECVCFFCRLLIIMDFVDYRSIQKQLVQNKRLFRSVSASVFSGATIYHNKVLNSNIGFTFSFFWSGSISSQTPSCVCPHTPKRPTYAPGILPPPRVRPNTPSLSTPTSASIIFKPTPFETLGGWGAESVAQVKMMGSALARHLGGEESKVIRHLVQRVSVLLVKVNANLLLNCVPNNSPPHIDGSE